MSLYCPQLLRFTVFLSFFLPLFILSILCYGSLPSCPVECYRLLLSK